MNSSRPIKGLGLLCAALLALWAITVSAHARLQSATPREGSRLAAAPGTLVLRFSESARLTALWIQKQGSEKQKLAPPTDALSEITVTLPKLEPGDYEVTWRVQGNDGHVVPGRLRFSVTPLP
jgi:methionine-rich copper-binding protein CopC